jgi:hypothetical protein
MKSGSLNLLEPSGPVQACNGIALPLPLHTIYEYGRGQRNTTRRATCSTSISVYYRGNIMCLEGVRQTRCYYVYSYLHETRVTSVSRSSCEWVTKWRCSRYCHYTSVLVIILNVLRSTQVPPSASSGVNINKILNCSCMTQNMQRLCI